MTAYYRPPIRRRPSNITFLGRLPTKRRFYKCKECDKLFKTKKGCKIHLVKTHLKKERDNPSYRKKTNLNKYIDKVII